MRSTAAGHLCGWCVNDAVPRKQHVFWQLHVNQINPVHRRAHGGVHLEFTLLPAMLRERFGYATHGVGKWHLGLGARAMTPARRGFDTWLGYFAGADILQTIVAMAPPCLPAARVILQDEPDMRQAHLAVVYSERARGGLVVQQDHRLVGGVKY